MKEPTIEQQMQSERYKDKYGVIWLKIDDFYVWNRKLGFGGWFGGKGLLELSK